MMSNQTPYGGRVVVALAGMLFAGGLLATQAVADPAPPPVNIGTTGVGGVITVTATSPGSSGGFGGGGGGSSSPVSSGGGGSSSGVGGFPSGYSGGGGSGGGSGSAGTSSVSTASSGPTLDAYGGAFCANLASADCGSSVAGAQPGTSSNPAAQLAYLNAVGQAVCKLGTTAACPVPGNPAAPAAPAAPGAPPPPPPPSPAQVAQIAISQLKLTAATPHVSANPNLAVGLPVWMWVDQALNTTGPVSTTATAGPTSVTAVATLSRIDWSMGPAGAVVSCAGPGTPAPAGPIFHGNTSPDCGYSYALRSLPERTGGTGKWPITATAVWNITWFGGGQAGGQGLNLTARTAVEVGELQSVFVAPGGGN